MSDTKRPQFFRIRAIWIIMIKSMNMILLLPLLLSGCVGVQLSTKLSEIKSNNPGYVVFSMSKPTIGGLEGLTLYFQLKENKEMNGWIKFYSDQNENNYLFISRIPKKDEKFYIFPIIYETPEKAKEKGFYEIYDRLSAIYVIKLPQGEYEFNKYLFTTSKMISQTKLQKTTYQAFITNNFSIKKGKITYLGEFDFQYDGINRDLVNLFIFNNKDRDISLACKKFKELKNVEIDVQISNTNSK